MLVHQTRLQQGSWINVYLIGSLSILWPGAADLDMPDPLYTCSALILQLIQLDMMQPKMLGSLRPGGPELPPELLARITGSQRLSRAVTKGVRSFRCATPTLKQLETWDI